MRMVLNHIKYSLWRIRICCQNAHLLSLVMLCINSWFRQERSFMSYIEINPFLHIYSFYWLCNQCRSKSSGTVSFLVTNNLMNQKAKSVEPLWMCWLIRIYTSYIQSVGLYPILLRVSTITHQTKGWHNVLYMLCEKWYKPTYCTLA
jgi:hypothetical protein